jgi:hypothetical protein
MARISFGRPSLGTLRSPLSPFVEKQLTADPMQQAAAQLKATQFTVPKPPKISFPKRKSNAFYGQ